MEQAKVTNWIQFWQTLAEIHTRGFCVDKQEDDGDFWKGRARHFNDLVKQRWSKPDSSRNYIISRLQATPGATLLDIGAGTGAWAVLLAKHVRKVTAVEPSSGMIEILKENVSAEGLNNVETIQGSWPGVETATYDYSICSHAMYGCYDLPAFVRKMLAVTKRTCFLLLRAPVAGSVMSRIAEHIWGHPYDSTNFQVAYNVLLQMGIYANVLFEDTGLWDPWTNTSLEEAFNDVKRRFSLGGIHKYDEFLRQILAEELVHEGGHYVWPRGVRSALVYWDTTDAL